MVVDISGGVGGVKGSPLALCLLVTTSVILFNYI